MENDYLEYIGVSTAPSDFKRLETNAKNVLLSIITCDIEAEDEAYLSAIFEQIYYFDNNRDLLDNPINFGGGFTIGKYSEQGNGDKIGNQDQNKRISPNAYAILLNAGYIYAGGLC